MLIYKIIEVETMDVKRYNFWWAMNDFYKYDLNPATDNGRREKWKDVGAHFVRVDVSVRAGGCWSIGMVRF